MQARREPAARMSSFSRSPGMRLRNLMSSRNSILVREWVRKAYTSVTDLGVTLVRAQTGLKVQNHERWIVANSFRRQLCRQFRRQKIAHRTMLNAGGVPIDGVLYILGCSRVHDDRIAGVRTGLDRRIWLNEEPRATVRAHCAYELLLELGEY